MLVLGYAWLLRPRNGELADSALAGEAVYCNILAVVALETLIIISSLCFVPKLRNESNLISESTECTAEAWIVFLCISP